MNLDDYLSSNKKELLNLFGQAHAARILETFINEKQTEDEDFLKGCCLDAVVAFKYMESDLDYPIDDVKIKLVDQKIANELYIITLCEEAVKKGSLIRMGCRYQPVIGFDPPNIPKKKKYIIPDTTM